VLERESRQRNGNEYDDRGLDDIDGVRVPLQEPAAPARPVEPLTEESDQPEGHSHRNGRIPQRIGRRLPVPVACEICASGEREGKESDRRDQRQEKARPPIDFGMFRNQLRRTATVPTMKKLRYWGR